MPRSGGRAGLLLLVAAASCAGLLSAQVAAAAPSSGPSPSPSARRATGPTAVDDSATVSVAGSVPLKGASNDVAGSAPITPALTVFPTTGQPKGSVVDEDGRRLQVVDHGTFVINPVDGSVAFTSWTGRSGSVAVTYRITDANGATDDGLLSVVVTAGGSRDYVLADYGKEVAVVDLLANDIPGRNANGTPGTLDRGSVSFIDNQPWGAVISDDGRTATVPNLGVATLDGYGLLTWRAYASSSEFGNSAEVFYTARDTTVATGGGQEHHSYVSLAVVGGNQNTDPNRVVTTDDHAATPFNASVTLPGTLNDHPHDPTATLRPELSRFDVGDLGPDDYLSPDGRKIRYPGRGTWTINPDGTVSYVPRRGFVGTDGVNMMVIDDQLYRGFEELVVTVEPGPTAKPDAVTLAQNVTTKVAVLANDLAGTNADGTAGSMDATYVRFPTDGQPSGATVSAYSRTLTVPGQGVYTADRTTGAISFDPEAGFVGKAKPVTYSAQDTVTRTDGRLVHNPVTSTLTVTVTAVSPVALNNWATTTVGKPVDVPVLGNDKPGAASAPLVPASIRLRLAPGLPDGSSLSGDAKTLTVKGQGTFKTRTDGVVVFTPVKDFVGRVATIGYQVSDANGTYARATITVQVAA